MTQAQKIAKEKFKKAIAYRTKTGVSLKEAFAHIYGKKVGVIKKKAAPKKKAASKKKAAIKKSAPKKKVASKKVAAIKIIEKSENKSTKAKATYQQIRTKKGTYKGLKKLSGLHNKRIVSGLPSYKDPDMARELELYADNDSLLYFQRRKPILINLSKKYKKGTYDIQKAAKLWRYYIDAALEKYNKEFGSRGDKWYDLMSVPDRNLLALEYAQNTKEEFDLGNFTEK